MACSRQGMGAMTRALVVAALLAAPGIARAQYDTPPDTTASDLARLAQQRMLQGDSLITETHIGIRFIPKYLNQINGDVNGVSMKNAFQVAAMTPFGSMFSFNVSAEEKHYRLQDKFDENKQLSATVGHTFDLFTNGSLSFIDNRVFNRSIIPGGAAQDYIFNDKSVNAGVAYKRAYDTDSRNIGRLRLDAIGNGSAVQGKRTYKDDQTLAAGGFGGVTTDFLGRRLTVGARGGHRETWDKSKTSLGEYGGLGSGEDSLSTAASAELADSIFVDAKYVYYEADRTWADQAQGSQGSQQQGVENVFQETERRSARGIVLALDAQVLKKFNVNVVGTHDSQLSDYVVQQTRFSNTVTDGLRGTFAYTTPWATTATVSLENFKTLRDLGPLSVSSYFDTRKKAGIMMGHHFNNGLSVDLNGNTMLTRSEYLDKVANPRDRDQIDTSVNLRISSAPFPKINASVSLAYSASEFVNIDSTQSENNRTRDLYELRPSFTYAFSEHLSVSQTYGIAIEYTDFTFKSSSNFLDRNLTFANKFDFRPTANITFVFDYSYNFHDNGSYLPDEETGEEVLLVQGEDRRDRVFLRVDYRLLQRVRESAQGTLHQTLGFFGENRFSRFEDRSVVSDTKTVTTDGQIVVGTRGDYELGTGRALKFSLARVKRFSKFGSDAEKNYWDMRSEFNYAF
jgi:hypothetical protein